MSSSLTPCAVDQLRARGREAFPPTIVDVRRRAAFERDPVRIPMSIRREPEAVDAWAAHLEPWRPVVVYCVHGHEVGQNAATALRTHGLDATYLQGGLEQWRESGAPVEPWAPPTRWVTRARPKIDRIACPWLVRRFVDASAEVFYVDANAVIAFAHDHAAVPFDVPDVEYTHDGERCSFDAFVTRHAQGDAALDALAAIVRAADTGAPAQPPAAAGLLAVSLGLGHGLADDAALMKHGMLVYDALYAWCRARPNERRFGGAAASGA